MHSYRLRYIVLGLLVLVACTSGRRKKSCGGRYSDPMSRAVESHLVIQATAIEGAWMTGGPPPSVMLFKPRSQNTMKGSLQTRNSSSTMRRRRRRGLAPVRVDWSGLCRPKNTLLSAPRRYILFLGKPDVNGTYPMTGAPLLLPESMKSKEYRRIAREVRKGSCKRCG